MTINLYLKSLIGYLLQFDVCSDEKIDLIRRFISFIDIAYVEKVK